MAVPASTVQTFGMVGIRESLSDVITNIMPLETPVYTLAKKRSVESRTPEWQRDIDADPDPANAVIEGDDIANDASVQPQRLRNIVQLFDKVAQVSSTASAVKAAGRQDEMKFQLAKRGREIKRDVEARFQGNFASVLGTNSAAGFCGGIESFMASNVSRGTGGASGGYNTGTALLVAATDATDPNIRVITEDLFKGVISDVWTNGGDADTVIMGAKMKQKASTTFAGIATLRSDVEGQTKITSIGGLDFYRSDFGRHKIMPTRLGCYGTGRTRVYRPASAAELLVANRTVLMLTPSTWTASFLQPFKQKPLAELGHSTRRMISCEVTLECADERANGVLADVKVA